MLSQKMPLLCCFKSPYAWCIKAPFMIKLSNIRKPINIRLGLPYVAMFIDKGWITLITRD